MALIKAILEAFYPNTCVGCGEVIDESEFLCDFCMVELKAIDLSKFCFKCGSPKRDCKCSKTVLFYDGCVAPLYNDGLAKRVMYSYKFRHREAYNKIFSYKMALAVRQGFFEVNFDLICCVPLEKGKRFKRGYNQSKLLADELAKILKLPFVDDVLGCNKKKRLQHRTAAKERFKNIAGVYFVKRPLKNKTVLLVDDIKTTGATLSECAKQLLSCGCDRVYCVTALLTDKKKGNKNGN